MIQSVGEPVVLEAAICDLKRGETAEAEAASGASGPGTSSLGKSQPLAPMKRIESMILLVRGHKVMLDADLAQLYGVETRALNQAVKRNKKRFPRDFMFPLTRDEIKRISQSVTSSPGRARLRFSKSVTAFTEHGVAMLSSVLNSERAVQVNIEIMRAFVRLRGILAAHKELSHRLDALEKKYDKQFAVVFRAIRGFMGPPEEPPKRRIGFKPRKG